MIPMKATKVRQTTFRHWGFLSDKTDKMFRAIVTDMARTVLKDQPARAGLDPKNPTVVVFSMPLLGDDFMCERGGPEWRIPLSEIVDSFLEFDSENEAAVYKLRDWLRATADEIDKGWPADV